MSLIYARLPDGSTNPAWLEARRGRITASHVHRIMGTPLVRGNYLLDLLTERLVGQISEQKVTEAMQAGIDREDIAGRRYEEETGRALIQGYWIWDEKRGLGGTPDFIVSDGGGIEVKCPQPKGAVAARFADALGAKWAPELKVRVILCLCANILALVPIPQRRPLFQWMEWLNLSSRGVTI